MSETERVLNLAEPGKLRIMATNRRNGIDGLFNAVIRTMDQSMADWIVTIVMEKK